jgi:hypothetical protein
MYTTPHHTLTHSQQPPSLEGGPLICQPEDFGGKMSVLNPGSESHWHGWLNKSGRVMYVPSLFDVPSCVPSLLPSCVPSFVFRHLPSFLPLFPRSFFIAWLLSLLPCYTHPFFIPSSFPPSLPSRYTKKWTAWKKRYFSLDDAQLTYYTDGDEMNEPKRSIKLEEAHGVLNFPHSDYKFAIFTVSRMWLLSNETAGYVSFLPSFVFLYALLPFFLYACMHAFLYVFLPSLGPLTHPSFLQERTHS